MKKSSALKRRRRIGKLRPIRANALDRRAAATLYLQVRAVRDDPLRFSAASEEV
jgi:hypothetical protein